MKKSCILVLGAHRSGTSALTRTLSLLGADLPNNLLDPQPDNPTGFWESRDHVFLNDKLLGRLGLHWDSFLKGRWDLLDRTSFVQYRDRIVELLSRDFDSSQLFIIKDPRLCRLLPVWRAALERFGAEAKCILLVRHPLEVAGSLASRNQLPLQIGLFVWLRYLLEAEAESRDLNRVFVSYENLLNDWRATALRIAQTLNVEWPQTQTDASEIDNFLQRDAQHQLLGDPNADAIDGVSALPAIRRAYEAACAASRDDSADVRAAFHELRVFVSDAESLIRPVISELHRSVTDNEKLTADIGQLRQFLSASQQELSDKARQIAELTSASQLQLSDQRRQIAELTKLSGDTAELRQLLSASQQELSDKARQIAELTRLTEVTAQLREHNQQLRAGTAQLQQALTASEQELDDKAREIVAFKLLEQRMVAAQAARDRELAAAFAMQTAQSEELNKAKRANALMSWNLVRLDAELLELHSSVSWRLTAPLREMVRLWDRLKRTLWARRYRFRLQPCLHLTPVDSNRNVWEAADSHSHFLLIPKSGRLPTRWCEIRVGLHHLDGPHQGLLYVDTGNGFTENTAIKLPPHERGELRTVVELPRLIRGLRLCPRQKAGRFEIREVVIREITRGRAKQLKRSLARFSAVLGAGPSSDKPALIPAQPSEGGGLSEIDLKTLVRGRLKAELDAFLASGTDLVLPQSRAPLTSIVLVLYNQAELTYNCLCSIVAHGGNDIEVIIVDNASTDRTSELLSHLHGAIVIRNQENRYFPPACNQAAEHANGKHLLLLNNDAQLLSGSLQAATDVLEHDETVGAVGGRILNLTGRLQEAGSILWSDGSAAGYGRGDVSDLPRYMFRRDVDFCSAAFLLTRTRLFRDLGGFDEIFTPAYYEEVDFCLRLWKQNLRVVYEPHAAIVHFEYGSSDSAFAANLATRNCRIIRSKHADYLTKRQAPGLENVLRARVGRISALRILFIDDRVPHLDEGSGYPRANEIANAMSRMGAVVTLFPMTRSQETWPRVYRDLEREIEVMADSSATSLETFLNERRAHYDVILVSRPHNMRYLLQVLKDKSSLNKSRLIYDAEAVFALRTQARARMLGEVESEAAAELADEMQLAGNADDIICVSEIERRHFVDSGLASVFILGHCLDPKPSANSFEQRRDILFVGAMNSSGSPNEDSVRWFSTYVLPLIRSGLPTDNVRLIVVGQNTAQELSDLTQHPSVEVIGSVRDLSSYYEQARIFVAPTRFGAGIPIKILDAASHGVPVVATSLMAAQLGWVDGEQLLTAEETDPQSFANQCLRLYRDKDLWLHLREEALTRVQEDCSPGRFQEDLRTILGLRKPHVWTAAVDSTLRDPDPAAIRLDS
jgi:GT2 family glycosyltransferase/glycosyltransferase involved in cell wall biosynthesis